MSFKVCIVGRPNVGKSSLFNRLIGYRKSVVDEISGSTRDRLYASTTWNNQNFSIIDTGGIEFLNSSLLVSMKAQVDIAILESDLILFVVDIKSGLTNQDYMIANELYKVDKPVIVVCNKMDDISFQSDIFEFYSLGLDTPIGVSTKHGIGIGDLLDLIVSHIKEPISNIDDSDDVKIAIIGKPNVGKSSLLNALLRKDRTIVSDISGTTRDSVDDIVKYHSKTYRFIDTAGIRKASQIIENNEKYSVIKALEALERADIGLIVLDYKNIDILDKHVAGHIQEYFRACIICINKWDLSDGDSNEMAKFEKKIKEEFKFLDYAVVVFVSALEKKRLNTIFPAIETCYTNFTKDFTTSLLNNLLLDIVTKNPPKIFNGGKASFSYITQISTKPPTFLVFCNNPDYIHFSYERYILNELRKNIDFIGTPIKLVFRKKEDNL